MTKVEFDTLVSSRANNILAVNFTKPDFEQHEMDRYCDCPSCERQLMLHYESLERKEPNDDEEYYRCEGFDSTGKMIWTKVDI